MLDMHFLYFILIDKVLVKIKLASKIFKRNDWYVTSPFGYREPIQTKQGITSNFHNGCDYGTNGEKWAQYALENGNIISCGIASDGAKYIWVNYPRINKKLLHYHLDSICVKTGQSVYEGLLLGYTGSTGMATGIHLHLGMKNSDGGSYENPHDYDYQSNDVNFSDVNSIDLTKIAYDVIAGKYGDGQTRVDKLTKNGYNASVVQQIVNEIKNKELDGTNYYIVKKGDTLIKIAKQFKTTWEKIYELNRDIIGDNTNLIKIGQRLKI